MLKYIKTDNNYLVRLLRGEKIIEKLQKFCELNNINSAIFTGLGGASDIELGYYNLITKEYEWKKFPEVHEVLSLNGNVSLADSRPVIHAHMNISNRNLESFGGHLKEAIVGGTLEIFISPISANLTRIMDDEIGLKLLNLPEE